MAGQPGQRRHAQREPGIAALASPQEQLDEQEVHRALRRIGQVSHQVDRQLMARRCVPQVGEGHDAAFHFHQRHRETCQVGWIEAAQREAFLLAGLVVQPGAGNR